MIFISLYLQVYNLTDGLNKVYLFIDEIQLVEKWEEAINSFLMDLDANI